MSQPKFIESVGILFIALTPGYAPNLMSFLFGNILAVTKGNLAAMLVLDAVLAGVMVFLYRPVLHVAFDREYAASQGVRTGFISYMMAILTAVTIVLSIRVVGIVLLISLLAIPPVIAGVFTASFARMMTLSAAISAAGMLAGLFISYRVDTPSGASTIIVLAAALILVKIAALSLKRYKFAKALK